MNIIMYGIIYASAVIFLAACLVRTVRYARAPVHLRWELYPVAHENPERVRHGGSYFEATDWWTRPARFNLWGEIRFIVPEILLLQGLWEFNRKLWLRSFPFHFGLYMLVATFGLIISHAAVGLTAPDLLTGAFDPAWSYLYRFTGVMGSGLVMLGAAGLLVRRLTDPELKLYTAGGDIFNLLFFLVADCLVAAGYLFKGPDAPGLEAVARGILTFDASLKITGLLSAGLTMGAVLVAYIPLTHMSHFIAKYFTYHAVRWDDAPAARRAQIRAKISEYLTYRPTWSASHVGADGTKTWGEVVTADPAKGVKK